MVITLHRTQMSGTHTGEQIHYETVKSTPVFQLSGLLRDSTPVLPTTLGLTSPDLCNDFSAILLLNTRFFLNLIATYIDEHIIFSSKYHCRKQSSHNKENVYLTSGIITMIIESQSKLCRQFVTFSESDPSPCIIIPLWGKRDGLFYFIFFNKYQLQVEVTMVNWFQHSRLMILFWQNKLALAPCAFKENNVLECIFMDAINQFTTSSRKAVHVVGVPIKTWFSCYIFRCLELKKQNKPQCLWLADVSRAFFNETNCMKLTRVCCVAVLLPPTVEKLLKSQREVSS